MLNYLSWTQLDLFEHSPEQYKRIYIEGGKMPINRGMALGKEIAQALEDGTETGDFIKDFTLASVPKLDIPEMVIETALNVGGVKTKLKCVIDSISQDGNRMIEYKTGVTPWDQKKADKHGQITFYCVALNEMHCRWPKDIELIWMPTQLNDGKPELTGEIKRFKTARTTADILKMKIRIKNAWLAINKLIQETII